MRKLLPFILLLIIGGLIIADQIPFTDGRTPAKRFEEGMNFVEFTTYVDPDLGYSFEYPVFFSREDLPTFGIGHVRFGYHADSANIVIECRVMPGRFRNGRKDDDVETGAVDGVDGHRFFTHYVRHQGCWYVLTVYYPDAYRQALERLLYRVKIWSPFPEMIPSLRQS